MRAMLARPLLQSLRVRLTLWYVALLAVILLLFSGVLFLRLNQTLYDNLDDTLHNRAEGVMGTVVDVAGRPQLRDSGMRTGRTQGDSFTRVFDGTSALVSDDSAALGSVPLFPLDVATAERGGSTLRSVNIDESRLRVLTLPLTPLGRGVLQIGVPEDDIQHTLTVLFAILAVLVPTMLLIASGGGLFLARRALAPVDRINRAARAIEATDLHQRLPEPVIEDEVGRLARTLNALIARLDAAFARQRQFTADAAHELRTPLTIMQGELEVTLRRVRTGEEYRETLVGVREQVMYMETLTADLLLLARSDAPLPTPMTRVDLAEITQEVCASLTVLANARGQTLTFEGAHPVIMAGIAADLARLVRNLVENALRYTPTGGRATVTVQTVDMTAQLKVADTGQGIAPEAIPQLFERFYRADAARSRAAGGTGLGLAIAQAIVRRHGGEIQVTSTVGEGSVFTVTFLGESEAGCTRDVHAVRAHSVKE